MYLITHIYSGFITITIVCIQADIFHQSVLLRVNKFIIQYFTGPLNESEFLIAFSFSFPVIQTFKLVSYSLTSHFSGPGSHLKILGSWVPGPIYGVRGPESHLIILGSRDPLMEYLVPGPT